MDNGGGITFRALIAMYLVCVVVVVAVGGRLNDAVIAWISSR